MGSCTRRHFMLSTCLLQMITIIERQVFDFLGYMWAPILVNFFHIIFIILGFYGAYHFRIKYIITYLIWSFIWIGWNAFLICFYLNVGILDRDSDLLNLGTGSVSWFEVNGYGCKPTYPINITSDDPFRPIRPERVDDCLVDYTIVEIVQSGVQCALALLGILGAILISYIFLDEDDRSLKMFVYMPERYLKNIQRFGANFECRNAMSADFSIQLKIKIIIKALNYIPLKYNFLHKS
ncbi:sodium/potassium-transporting ATPase subunit beta-1-interacting protein isoform X6 [Bactrocera oleae]|uniref:sodium/potassium-transporting ATPase subunit beta-1-interacting protein isoform X6 n=1 Tax=Bactrocera oleae TaxID=104688 RepID=UPI00387E42ED